MVAAAHNAAVFPAGDPCAAARGAEPVRPGAAAADELAHFAAVDRRWQSPFLLGTGRTGPRRISAILYGCVFRSPRVLGVLLYGTRASCLG